MCHRATRRLIITRKKRWESQAIAPPKLHPNLTVDSIPKKETLTHERLLFGNVLVEIRFMPLTSVGH
jgi:MOSC domain-containing protein YiiM